MRPIYFIVHHIHVPSSIMSAQNIGAETFFSIDGSLAIDGVASISNNTSVVSPQAQKISFDSNADESGVTLFVVGTDAAGVVISETFAFDGSETSQQTAKHYSTVTSIRAIEDTAGAVFAGWNTDGELISKPYPVNWRQCPANITLAEEPYPDAAGTADAQGSMQYSHDDPQDPDTFPSYSEDAAWIPVSDLVGVVVATDTFLSGPVRALRGVIGPDVGGGTENSWRFKIIQGNTN